MSNVQDITQPDDGNGAFNVTLTGHALRKFRQRLLKKHARSAIDDEAIVNAVTTMLRGARVVRQDSLSVRMMYGNIVFVANVQDRDVKILTIYKEATNHGKRLQGRSRLGRSVPPRERTGQEQQEASEVLRRRNRREKRR